MLRTLDAAKSTYSVSFASLCREVFTARSEANDNVRYLWPLRQFFDDMESEPHFPSLVNVSRSPALLHAYPPVFAWNPLDTPGDLCRNEAATHRAPHTASPPITPHSTSGPSSTGF